MPFRPHRRVAELGTIPVGQSPGGRIVARNRVLLPICATVVLLLAAGVADAGIHWRSDIRRALQEAEERGVPALIYLSRDT